jgi:hypothetical protein
MKLLYDNVDIIDLLERMYDNYELTGEMDLWVTTGNKT